MQLLRTNTAARITVGPFFDKTDGVTPETALTVTSCKLTFVVDDANVPTLVLDTNPTASGGNNDMVHITGDDAGYYDLELTAANVNYLGRAKLAITDAATHCPVFHEFMILPAVVYDAMVLGTDLLDVSATQLAGSTTAASKLSSSALTICTVTVTTGSTTTDVVTSSIDPTTVDLDQFAGRILLFLSTTTTTGLRGQGGRITDVDAAGIITLQDALSQAPASGDIAVIV